MRLLCWKIDTDYEQLKGTSLQNLRVSNLGNRFTLFKFTLFKGTWYPSRAPWVNCLLLRPDNPRLYSHHFSVVALRPAPTKSHPRLMGVDEVAHGALWGNGEPASLEVAQMHVEHVTLDALFSASEQFAIWASMPSLAGVEL